MQLTKGKKKITFFLLFKPLRTVPILHGTNFSKLI